MPQLHFTIQMFLINSSDCGLRAVVLMGWVCQVGVVSRGCHSARWLSRIE